SSQLRHALRNGVQGPLSVVEMRGMEFLISRPAARQKELAAYWGITNASTSAFIAKMEKLGFIARHRDPDDGRSSVLEVTSSGRAAVAETGRRAGEVCRPYFERLSEQELEQLESILNKIRPG
ncbi:MAG TPA: MarR family transcriptional regulator, partial [Devosia sp.]|nr:MarR family transcriptional regulator [Devosia sp.]